MSSWVKLNVGGQKFVTNTSVFMSDPGCMLAKMFNGEMRPGDKDEDGAYFIDRSPDYFKPILNYFRTGKIIIDHNINVEGVLEEAKYYGIESLVSLLQDIICNDSKVKDSDEELEKLRKQMDILCMYNKLERDYVKVDPE